MIAKWRETSSEFDATLMDQSKVFDTLDCNLFFTKLNTYGLFVNGKRYSFFL